MFKCNNCDTTLLLFYSTPKGTYYLCPSCHSVVFNSLDKSCCIKKHDVLVTLPSEVFEFYNQTLSVVSMEDYIYRCPVCNYFACKDLDSYKCLNCTFTWEVKHVR